MKEPETFDEAFEMICDELRELAVMKNKAYGSENLIALGERGIFVRVHDKFSRLKNLVWDHPERLEDAERFEATEDTWRDFSNYGILEIMRRRNWLRLPYRAALPYRGEK